MGGFQTLILEEPRSCMVVVVRGCIRVASRLLGRPMRRSSLREFDCL